MYYYEHMNTIRYIHVTWKLLFDVNANLNVILLVQCDLSNTFVFYCFILYKRHIKSKLKTLFKCNGSRFHLFRYDLYLCEFNLRFQTKPIVVHWNIFFLGTFIPNKLRLQKMSKNEYDYCSPGGLMPVSRIKYVPNIRC